jgi:phosphoribosylaminoimidazole carboxylase (NCAIR synthetase)
VEFNGSYTDAALLGRFLAEVDVVTAEFENIPDACLRAVEAVKPLRPGRMAIYTAQHREREKLFLREHGIACAPFRIVEDLAGLERAVAELGRPCVIKTAAFGYDGKGQAKVTEATVLAEVWKAFEGAHAVVEQWVPFVMEVSVVGARGAKQKIAEIETTGGSNAEPGMLTVPTPIGGGIRALVSLAKTGVSADQHRTARMLTAAMAEKLEAQGYVLPGRKEKVKRLEAPSASAGRGE